MTWQTFKNSFSCTLNANCKDHSSMVGFNKKNMSSIINSFAKIDNELQEYFVRCYKTIVINCYIIYCYKTISIWIDFPLSSFI